MGNEASMGGVGYWRIKLNTQGQCKISLNLEGREEEQAPKPSV